jgi:hypothetical protein
MPPCPDHVVELLGDFGALGDFGGLAEFGNQRVIGRIAESVDVLALPLCLGPRSLFAQVYCPDRLRIGAVEVVGVHLDVGVELLESVRRGRIAAEEHRCVDVAARFRRRSPTTTA